MNAYLDVRKLLALREVVSRGTIAAAAEALRVTPSAISQQVSSLEQAAGVPLLVRSTRGVQPTPAGRALVDRAHAIAAELELAESELRASGGEAAGVVTIAAFATALRGIVAPALPRLRELHPGLHPCVRELDPSDALPALASGELDVALVFGYDLLDRPGHGGCEFEHVLDDPMFLAVPEADFGDERLDLALLADRSWICAWPGTPCHETTIRACHRAGFTPEVTATSHDFSVILSLVQAGAGVALVPMLALDHVPDGVRIVEPAGEPVLRRIHAAYRRGGRRRPAVDATIGELVSAARRWSSEPALAT